MTGRTADTENTRVPPLFSLSCINIDVATKSSSWKGTEEKDVMSTLFLVSISKHNSVTKHNTFLYELKLNASHQSNMHGNHWQPDTSA